MKNEKTNDTMKLMVEQFFKKIVNVKENFTGKLTLETNWNQGGLNDFERVERERFK